MGGELALPACSWQGEGVGWHLRVSTLEADERLRLGNEALTLRVPAPADDVHSRTTPA